MGKVIGNAGREMCWRCFWPKSLCWCASIVGMPTRTKLVILMHPKEFKHVKANTGRLASLCLQNAEVHMGLCFDQHPRILELRANQNNHCMVLFPDPDALVLDSTQETSAIGLTHDKQLVVFLFDATWSCAKAMARQNATLMALPKLMFNSPQKSRYTIKQQPNDSCLSTLEACHELLCTLELSGLDSYPDKTTMLALFERMQNYQIACAQGKVSGVRRR